MNFVKNILLALLLAQPLTAWAQFTDGPFEGRVLDFDTDKPISGAIVIARWETTVVMSGQGTCIHAETAVSGDDGTYKIPRWWQVPPALFVGAGRVLDVYKEGYEHVHSPWHTNGWQGGEWTVYRWDRPNETRRTFPDEASAKAAAHQTDVYLKPFTGNASERFEYLRGRVVSGTSCNNAGTSKRNLYPVVKAAYKEAKPLAITHEQKRLLDILRTIGLSTWLALPVNAEMPKNPAYPEQVLKDLE